MPAGLGRDLATRALARAMQESAHGGLIPAVTRQLLIFERYLVLGSVLVLAESLKAVSIKSKARVSRTGKEFGNAAFSRGALYLMLQNRIYLGEVMHKGKA